MLDMMLLASLVIIALAILGCLYRVLKGPSMSDRIIALDMIGVNLIAMVAIISIMLNTQAFLEIILLIGILAFLGTIAFSKYIERGVVIEHERDD
ncbi:Na(+)/H(+) antiporter subunit F1 [Marinicrinis sediminis]|uniref:Na(+)/H(+) antiporter subunit F1 n=1 Tax=Marinicrinis sediminis TaxID=1652465 RepID=A0ABW5R6R1_9BACL